MRLEMTGVIVYTTNKMWCYGSLKKGKRLNRTIDFYYINLMYYTQAQILLFLFVSVVNVVCYPPQVLLHCPLPMVLADSLDFLLIHATSKSILKLLTDMFISLLSA